MAIYGSGVLRGNNLQMEKYKYVSLFSGGGIGDKGFKDAGLMPIVMNELDVDRANIIRSNYHETSIVVGDIAAHMDEIYNKTVKSLAGERLFMLVATPPCQGMSKNGIGTIKKSIRDGKRLQIDERNYLYKYALELLKRLTPKFFVWENVDRMFNTVIINKDGKEVLFVDEFMALLEEAGYIGKFEIQNMAEFGIPQNSRRNNRDAARIR